jgi:hypothetical protein
MRNYAESQFFRTSPEISLSTFYGSNNLIYGRPPRSFKRSAAWGVFSQPYYNSPLKTFLKIAWGKAFNADNCLSQEALARSTSCIRPVEDDFFSVIFLLQTLAYPEEPDCLFRRYPPSITITTQRFKERGNC